MLSSLMGKNFYPNLLKHVTIVSEYLTCISAIQQTYLC